MTRGSTIPSSLNRHTRFGTCIRGSRASGVHVYGDTHSLAHARLPGTLGQQMPLQLNFSLYLFVGDFSGGTHRARRCRKADVISSGPLQRQGRFIALPMLTGSWATRRTCGGAAAVGCSAANNLETAAPWKRGKQSHIREDSESAGLLCIILTTTNTRRACGKQEGAIFNEQ